ncbi:MAG: hypothetical protein K0Q73_3836 [Paenibacillus sp.]|nr:hypothetical protein [Paenibacillus sp.]
MGLKLCLDCGGTKTLGLLFDEQYRLLGIGQGGATNLRFETEETIDAAMRTCLKNCLGDHVGVELDKVYMTSFKNRDKLMDIIRESCKVNQVHILSEGETCLLAGAQTREGMVALSGTGSTLFDLNKQSQAVAGGWGSWIGDEGSGYYIGNHGIVSAIRHSEGRGQETLITEFIMEQFKLKQLRQFIQLLYDNNSPRNVISSISMLVSKAARFDDESALQILRGAGAAMAEQMVAFISREKNRSEKMIVVAGGAWKSGRIMFDTFCATVRGQYPEIKIQLPIYEPVMGGVIEDMLLAGIDPRVEAPMDNLLQPFDFFQYRLQ